MHHVLDISVVIPSHPARASSGMLQRAVDSVMAQTLSPSSIIVEMDLNRQGACITRNRGVDKVTTEWVAFLDSDDTFYPHHLETLAEAVEGTGADFVYSWFDLVNADGHNINHQDPVGGFGRVFDGRRLERGNFIPVTVLVRTEAVQSVGGFEVASPGNPCEDWGCWRKIYRAGFKFQHVPQRTWVWNWHGKNTAGLTNKGDAK
jgi:glycosyltransferase involved in cell wall biosynthesis